jgi:hypothetical protein
MRTFAQSIAAAGALAVMAGLASAQAGAHFPTYNNLLMNNGGDVIYIFSDPSVGFAVGTNPPDVNGDLYWKVVPGKAMTTASGTIEIQGFEETLYDGDWNTPPDFYDRVLGAAVDSAAGTGANPGNLEPTFFSQGLGTADVLISVGNSGFPNPCTVSPAFCGGAACHPTGIPGYITAITFGSTPGTGLVIPADGTSNSAVTYFLPGGMTWSSVPFGPCGTGDYSFNGAFSTDEHLADTTGAGLSPFGGFAVGGSGPLADLNTDAEENNLEFFGAVIQAEVSDTALGWGPEPGTAGLDLSVGSGGATIGVRLRHIEGGLTGNSAFCAGSLTELPAPGVPVLGANLLILPDSIFNSTAGVWVGTIVVGTPAGYVVQEGDFTSIQLPVPATAAGINLQIQGFSIDFNTFTAAGSNVFESSFRP